MVITKNLFTTQQREMLPRREQKHFKIQQPCNVHAAYLEYEEQSDVFINRGNWYRLIIVHEAVG